MNDRNWKSKACEPVVHFADDFRHILDEEVGRLDFRGGKRGRHNALQGEFAQVAPQVPRVLRFAM